MSDFLVASAWIYSLRKDGFLKIGDVQFDNASVLFYFSVFCVLIKGVFLRA